MLTIASLFGKSPFAPLQTHIDKVACSVGQLPALFKAILEQDLEAIGKIGEEIARLKSEADVTKTDIQTHLPKSLFLPVNHKALLEILFLQDALVDQTEKIAEKAAMRELVFLPEMKEEFNKLCEKTMEIFWLVRQVIKELDDLLESSFGGIEAQKVKRMIEQITFCEKEKHKRHLWLTKHLYRNGDSIPYPVLHLFLTLIEEIGNLATLSGKLSNLVRMLLELK